MDLYFCPGQRKPYIDTIPQVGRESMIFGKPGKKELYNTFSAYFFLKRQKKKSSKIYSQWSGDSPEKKTFLNRFSKDSV